MYFTYYNAIQTISLYIISYVLYIILALSGTINICNHLSVKIIIQNIMYFQNGWENIDSLSTMLDMSHCWLVGLAVVGCHPSIVVLGVYPPWWPTIGEYGWEGGVDGRLWRGRIWYSVLVDTLLLTLFFNIFFRGFSCSTSHSGTDHHRIIVSPQLTMSGLGKCQNFHGVHLRQVSI